MLVEMTLVWNHAEPGTLPMKITVVHSEAVVIVMRNGNLYFIISRC